MVSVKQASQNALTFARDLLGDTRVNSLLLEEIELSDDQKQWLVTISIPSARLTSAGLAMFGAAGEAGPRDYKLIRVDTNTGEPLSLTIRKV
jgi:hypothetical protein